jgi:hypothetical protein
MKKALNWIGIVTASLALLGIVGYLALRSTIPGWGGSNRESPKKEYLPAWKQQSHSRM